MTFEQRLQVALDDLSQYKRDKSELLPYYVNMRLTKSLQTYYSELNSSIQYLYNKDPIKVVKKLKEQ